MQLARSDMGAGPLGFAGIALIALGYFYMMAVYTLDEKFKRNTSELRETEVCNRSGELTETFRLDSLRSIDSCRVVLLVVRPDSERVISRRPLRSRQSRDRRRDGFLGRLGRWKRGGPRDQSAARSPTTGSRSSGSK